MSLLEGRGGPPLVCRPSAGRGQLGRAFPGGLDALSLGLAWAWLGILGLILVDLWLSGGFGLALAGFGLVWLGFSTFACFYYDFCPFSLS